MDNKEISGNEVSEKNKKALQSETWKEVRKIMKTEIAHFTDTPKILDFEAVKVNKSDGAYGIMWGRLVRDYLKVAYSGEIAEAEIASEGITYKVLKRGDVTAFYDADGNTLFDVENKRLEKEYGRLVKENPLAVPVKESSNILSPNAYEVAGRAEKVSVKQVAKEKLEKELEGDKDKSFAEPVIGYLLERCAEDEGLSQDVVQEHKTWKKCIGYIYEKARKQSSGNKAAIRDDVVYEWAEDYFHKDDKAEDAEKARKEAERKEKQKKAEADRAKAKKNPDKATTKSEQKEDTPKEQPKPKKNNKDMEGQLDMFSMMGM